MISKTKLVIYPYRNEFTWVFDDDTVDLVSEPFVCGVPQMIDILVKDIFKAEFGFKLIFSKIAFPEYQAELKWLREESGGHWYRWQEHNLEGWLCPALFKYFLEAPATIYCQAIGLIKE
jgi:hypothetical protein